MTAPELAFARAPDQLRANQRVLAAAIGHAIVVAGLLAAGIRAVADGHATLLPVIWLLLGLGVCWNANTVAHIHLHTPLARSRAGNQIVSWFLTLLLGIPQRLWRRRHFEHHGLPQGPRSAERRAAALEAALLLLAVAGLLIAAPRLLLQVFLPGTLVGLGLCALQGWGEHHRAPAGCDHHGRLYNALWFNDGHHAAHHRDPHRHFTLLVADVRPEDRISPWPPLLRFLPALMGGLMGGLMGALMGATRAAIPAVLDALEHAVLRLPPLQRFLLATHERPLRQLLARIDVQRIQRIVIVGGGIFPRSALLLGHLVPHARITLLDVALPHLQAAMSILPATLRERVDLLCDCFDPAAPQALTSQPAAGPTGVGACDLLVVPLALRGDRTSLYGRPPAPMVLVHDWSWRRVGAAGARLPWLFCKRINLVVRSAAAAAPIALCAHPHAAEHACLSPVAPNTATLSPQPACSRLTSSSALPAATATPS